MAELTKPETIDEYIATFPADTQKKLKQIRSAIRKKVPAAVERISYGIPAFNLNKKYLIYFAGYKNHVSIYPVPTGNKVLDKAFAPYRTSGKGTIQFPLDEDLPLALIDKIIEFRVKENERKAKV